MRAQTASPPLRVLVVDDSADVTDSMAALVRLWGHDVRTALNGADALRIGIVYRPHVVLLDVNMPGMDGYQLARRWRSDVALARAFLVSITGYGGEMEAEHSRAAGCDAYLLKPMDPAVLERLLAERKQEYERRIVRVEEDTEPAPPMPLRDVSEAAENRLRGHPYLALRHIACDYHDGVLTLRGCLPTYYLKQMAQSAVAPVEGVQRIENEIEVVASPSFSI